jgi:hypothetical protein
MLLQNPDDLLFRKAAALHVLVLVVGQNELQTGSSPRGKVKTTFEKLILLNSSEEMLSYSKKFQDFANL